LIIVEAIKDRIGPEEHSSALYHLLSCEKENDAGNGLIRKYPEATLKLIDKLIGEKEPLGDILLQVLNIINESKEVLSYDDTFRRLWALSE